MAIVMLLLAPALITWLGGASDCAWDLTYASSVRKATALKAPADRSRRELELLRQGVIASPTRAELQKAVEHAGSALEQVLVESVGAIPPGSERVWVTKTSTGVRAFTLAEFNVAGTPREVPITDAEWQRIVTLARATGTDSVLGRAGSDSPAYFVSIAVSGICRQFALYAPIFSPTIPEADREFNERVAREKALITEVLRLGRTRAPGAKEN